MDYGAFKVEKFEFIDESPWWIRVGHYIRDITRSRDTFVPSPIQFKKTAEQRRRNVLLDDSCAAICLNDPSLQNIITFHKQRLRLRRIVSSILYLLFAMPASQILFLGLIWLVSITKPLRQNLIVENSHTLTWLLDSALLALILLFMYVLMFVIIRTAFKVAGVLTIKHFAESLCAETIIYLILELTRNDVLTHPNKRRSLVARINDLARNTLLLSSRYRSKSEANQDWVREHFKRMEGYIRERERWAITPTESTLNDLRQDFYNLVAIYVAGNYGEFSWAKAAQPKPSPTPLTAMQHIFKSLPRFLGIVLPLLLMGFFMWQPARLVSIGIGANVVALIFIAWLLLAIDATLKLGIVAGVVNLAKEIKNLK